LAIHLKFSEKKLPVKMKDAFGCSPPRLHYGIEGKKHYSVGADPWVTLADIEMLST
jgi:hypothetical protein